MRPFWRTGRLAGMLAIVALLAACAQGCVAVLAGAAAAAGGVAYVKGDVERVYPIPIEIVHDATVATLAELDLAVTRQTVDQLAGSIEARTATGDRIIATLESRGTSTAIRLRINTFGNEPMSLEILSRIDRHLQGPPPEPIEALPTLAPAEAGAPPFPG